MPSSFRYIQSRGGMITKSTLQKGFYMYIEYEGMIFLEIPIKVHEHGTK
jgi:hypothetical protein